MYLGFDLNKNKTFKDITLKTRIVFFPYSLTFCITNNEFLNPENDQQMNPEQTYLLVSALMFVERLTTGRGTSG